MNSLKLKYLFTPDYTQDYIKKHLKEKSLSESVQKLHDTNQDKECLVFTRTSPSSVTMVWGWPSAFYTTELGGRNYNKIMNIIVNLFIFFYFSIVD